MPASTNNSFPQFLIADNCDCPEAPGYVGMAAMWTMDYPELKEKFRVGKKVVCVKPKGSVGNWGQVFTVTGYSPVTPGLTFAETNLSSDGGNFQLLDNFPLCPHNTHIKGGDCPNCAHDKLNAIIDARQPYTLANDPAYAQLMQEAKRLGFTTRTAYILEMVEGDKILRFADPEAAIAYVKTYTDLDTEVYLYEVPDYLSVETTGVVDVDNVVAKITTRTGVSPKHSTFRSEQSWLWSFGDDKWIEVDMPSATKPVQIRLYNSDAQLPS